jgi:hypothetical protein
VLWDVAWIDADGTPLVQQRQRTEEAAQLQTQHWLADKPDARVSLYRWRGGTSVLVRVLTADSPHRLTR